MTVFKQIAKARSEEVLRLVNSIITNVNLFGPANFKAPLFTEETITKHPLHLGVMRASVPDQFLASLANFLTGDRKSEYPLLTEIVLSEQAMRAIAENDLVSIEQAAAYSGMQINSYRTKMSRMKAQTVNVSNRAYLTPAEVMRLRSV